MFEVQASAGNTSGKFNDLRERGPAFSRKFHTLQESFAHVVKFCVLSEFQSRFANCREVLQTSEQFCELQRSCGHFRDVLWMSEKLRKLPGSCENFQAVLRTLWKFCDVCESLKNLLVNSVNFGEILRILRKLKRSFSNFRDILRT